MSFGAGTASAQGTLTNLIVLQRCALATTASVSVSSVFILTVTDSASSQVIPIAANSVANMWTDCISAINGVADYTIDISNRLLQLRHLEGSGGGGYSTQVDIHVSSQSVVAVIDTSISGGGGGGGIDTGILSAQTLAANAIIEALNGASSTLSGTLASSFIPALSKVTGVSIAAILESVRVTSLIVQNAVARSPTPSPSSAPMNAGLSALGLSSAAAIPIVSITVPLVVIFMFCVIGVAYRRRARRTAEDRGLALSAARVGLKVRGTNIDDSDDLVVSLADAVSQPVDPLSSFRKPRQHRFARERQRHHHRHYYSPQQHSIMEGGGGGDGGGNSDYNDDDNYYDDDNEMGQTDTMNPLVARNTSSSSPTTKTTMTNILSPPEFLRYQPQQALPGFVHSRQFSSSTTSSPSSFRGGGGASGGSPSTNNIHSPISSPTTTTNSNVDGGYRGGGGGGSQSLSPQAAARLIALVQGGYMAPGARLGGGGGGGGTMRPPKPPTSPPPLSFALGSRRNL
jgi:hypothetical protein